MQPLDADDLRSALGDLASRLARRNVHARLYVAGGAAMILAHHADRTTRDVDSAIEHGYEDVVEAAAEIARERGWPRSWINEQATPYMPPAGRRHGEAVFEHPHLTVIAAQATHMLVMKARAARRTDAADVRRLVSMTGVDSVAGIRDLVESVLPGETLSRRELLWLEDVLAEPAPGRRQSKDEMG